MNSFPKNLPDDLYFGTRFVSAEGGDIDRKLSQYVVGTRHEVSAIEPDTIAKLSKVDAESFFRGPWGKRFNTWFVKWEAAQLMQTANVATNAPRSARRI